MKPVHAALCVLFAATSCSSDAAPAAAPIEGDPARGEQVYAMCIGCHSLEVDRTGPRHCGLVGRHAASVPGFEYSDALVASGLVWDVSTLDRFLADPMATVPGTKMTFAGVKDDAERRDLIAWLAVAGADPARCGTP